MKFSITLNLMDMTGYQELISSKIDPIRNETVIAAEDSVLIFIPKIQFQNSKFILVLYLNMKFNY